MWSWVRTCDDDWSARHPMVWMRAREKRKDAREREREREREKEKTLRPSEWVSKWVRTFLTRHYYCQVLYMRERFNQFSLSPSASCRLAELVTLSLSLSFCTFSLLCHIFFRLFSYSLRFLPPLLLLSFSSCPFLAGLMARERERERESSGSKRIKVRVYKMAQANEKRKARRKAPKKAREDEVTKWLESIWLQKNRMNHCISRTESEPFAKWISLSLSLSLSLHVNVCVSTDLSAADAIECRKKRMKEEAKRIDSIPRVQTETGLTRRRKREREREKKKKREREFVDGVTIHLVGWQGHCSFSPTPCHQLHFAIHFLSSVSRLHTCHRL